jgi:hypothetical protein
MLGSEATTVGRNPQRPRCEFWGGKSRQGNQARWSGDGGHHEAVKVVEHRTCQELPQRPGVSRIGWTQRGKVARPIPLVHGGRGIAESDEDQVEDEATGPPIAVEKWVDSLETTVGRRQHFDWSGGLGDPADICDPIAHGGWDINPGSEFRRVIVTLPPPPSPILTRELLYTAVTRAKERVTLVGSEATLRAAITRPAVRASGLGPKLWP